MTLVDSFTGQRHITYILDQMIAAELLPRYFVLTGLAGNGKTVLAEKLASCLGGRAHHYDHIGKEDLNDIENISAYLIAPDGPDIFSLNLDHADVDVSSLLDSQPTKNFFVFEVTDPADLPVGLKALPSFDFKRNHVKTVFNFIRIRNQNIPNPLLAAACLRSAGNIERALYYVDEIQEHKIEDVDDFYNYYGHYDAAARILQALAQDDLQTAVDTVPQKNDEAEITFSQILALLSDLVVMRSGITPHMFSEEVASRDTLLPLVSPEKTLNALKLLWSKTDSYNKNHDKYEGLRLIVSLIYALWNPKSSTGTITEPISKVNTPNMEPVTASFISEALGGSVIN